MTKRRRNHVLEIGVAKVSQDGWKVVDALKSKKSSNFESRLPQRPKLVIKLQQASHKATSAVANDYNVVMVVTMFSGMGKEIGKSRRAVFRMIWMFEVFFGAFWDC